MKKRNLGSTGILVSPIGLGTVKFGRNQGVKYPAAFVIPSLSELKSLLDLAEDLGLNFLDTAPAYGMSEERLGTLLKGRRQDWVIVSKAGEIFQAGQSTYCFTPEFIKNSIHETLKKLKTDYLDVALIHSDGQDEAILDAGGLACLDLLKKEGKILATGMSTKTIAGGLRCVDEADIVMLTYNLEHQEERPVLDYAFKKHKGVLIKKALCSGHLEKLGGQDPIHTGLSFVFEHPAVTAAILGTINPEHLQHNVDVMRAIA